MLRTAPIPIPNSRNSRRSINRSPSPHPNLHLQTSYGQPSLLNRVRQKLNGFKHKYDFIPGDELDELMTPEYVKEITINLRLNDPSQPFHANTLLNEEDYARVHEKYRVILAILIKLSCEDHFIKFHNYNNAYDDSRLPFSKKELEHIDPQRVICDLFLTTQYEFIPQTISGSHSWTPEFVLPFIRKIDIGYGSFAKVYMVELYPLYDNIKETHFSNSKDHVYALKQLQESKEKDFILETHAGRLLGKRRHPNLLPLLAYYKHGSTFNMMFPHADCDLLKYYETCAPPKLVVERLEFMTRIHALTSALKAMHMGDSDQQSETLVGYHRDLKPRNILVLNGNFMIADFGFTRFRTRKPDDQEGSGVDWTYGGSAYWAPECDTRPGEEVMVGRAGDVWSLGCVFADVITFVVRGYEGVCAFKDHRTTVSARVTKDWFHNEGHVKPTVLDWFQSLVDLTSGDRFVEEFIRLLKKILQSRPEDRPTIADIESEFQDILCRERAILGIGVSTTTNTINTCVAGEVKATIGVTTQCIKTGPDSAPYEETFPTNSFTTERKATESIPTSSGESPHRGQMLWDRTKQPVTVATEESFAPPQRVHSNTLAPKSLALHSRSYSAIEHGFRDRGNQESMRESLLPASFYSASPQMVQQGSSSSYMREPTDLQTPDRPNHGWYSQDCLSLESALRYSNSGTTLPRSDSAVFASMTPSARRLLGSLRKYDTMFLVDDSYHIGNRWAAIKRSLAQFAFLATQYDVDGIDLAFIHSEVKYTGVTSTQLQELMAKIYAMSLANEESDSSNALSMSLDCHLSEYTRKYKERMDRGLTQKYLNLIVLTSGDPGYLDDFDDQVIDYARTFDNMNAPKFQLGIQFALIQCSPEDQERFKRLDDQEHVRDIVDATAYNPDTNKDLNKLLKVLCGAINRRIDNSESTIDAPSYTPQVGSINTTFSRSLTPYEPPAQVNFSPIVPVDQNMLGSANGDNGGISVYGLGIQSDSVTPTVLPITSSTQSFSNAGEEESSEKKSQPSAAEERKASDSLMSAPPPITPTAQSSTNVGEEESGEKKSQPSAVEESTISVASPPSSYSWSGTYPTAIAVATVACIVLYFISSWTL